MKTKWGWAYISLGLLSLLAAMLLGCGASSVTPTRMLVTADWANSRVLIHNVPFSTNQAASLVLGQPDFTQYAEKLTADGLAGAQAVAVDGSGNVYVGQYGINGTFACRVSVFQPPLSNGMRASVVLGEPDFTTGACTTSATGLTSPQGLALDSSGNLWVSDVMDSRIVQFKPPFRNGMAASLVIGQTDFAGNLCNRGGPPSASTVCMPGGVAFDTQGNLWVADNFNSRVLRFRPPFTTGMAASLVIGQPDMTSIAPGTLATVMAGPAALAFDLAGNLWVADYANTRVLQFQPPFTNGMAASLVIGHANFTDNSFAFPPTSSATMVPASLAFDTDGRLIVADLFRNRTLILTPPFSNGMAASVILGQPDSVSWLGNQNGSFTPAANTLYMPSWVTTW